jgi:dTDP-4-dehydrorhamnose reductase
MLGSDLDAHLQARGYRTRIYDLPDFDLTDAEQVKTALDAGEAVINCAAFTNVDGAETETQRAFQVNAEAVGQLGRLARASGSWVLHISTDFVFDGQLDRPYVETDDPKPLSVYGQSKLAGERALESSACDHAIVRVQWTYGHHGVNFVKKLLDRARQHGALKVVDDQVGSPTATVEVARALAVLVDQRTTGLYHCASHGYVSRFDMAKFVVDALGLDVPVEPCKTHDFASPAARPLNSRFNCDKLTGLLGMPMPSWQDSLKTFVEQL